MAVLKRRLPSNPRAVGAATVLTLALAGHTTAPAATAAPRPPGEASSVQETYGDWQVTCVEQAAGKKCALSQEHLDPRSRQRLMAIEIDPTASGASALLILPFGLALDRGVTFQIDGGAAGPPQRFRTCLPSGCLVVVALDAATVATLQRATALTVKAVADGGQDTLFTVSLKGFAAAFERVASLPP